MGGESDKLIRVGKIGRPHGVRGEVRVWPATPDSESILEVARLFVGKNEEQPRPMRFRNRRRGGRYFIVGFEDVASRDDAEKLNGSQIWIDKSELPELDNVEEFYLHQLIGLPVWTIDGQAIGEIAGVMETGASDVLVVGNEAGEEVLIPFVGQMVTIDLDAGKAVVDPPEGLLDATRTGGSGRES